MKTEKKNLEKNGSDISLKHFIYLDRKRLDSYSSQLLDGIVQIRRITENAGAKTTDSPNQQYTEHTEENGREGEISLGPKTYAGGFSAKGASKTTKKTGVKQGGQTTIDELSQSFSEDKIDYHNSYLLFEQELITKGILKEISRESQLNQYSSLIKITGISKFFDWESVMNFMDRQYEQVCSLLNLVGQEQVSPNTLNLAIQAVKTFSLGEITFHTKIENSILVASLNPENLCMTKDQLRSGYVMPGDIEATIVGFVPKRRIEQTTFPGLAGQLNMVDLWNELTGSVQTVIDPIAIYTEVHI